MPEFTDAQIEEGIRRALAKRDIQAVPGLIALLALQNPHRAETVRQTILFGLALAQDNKPTVPEHPDRSTT